MPSRPPTAETVVSRPNPTGAEAEPLAGVEHQNRPGRAERDVEDQDGQDQRAHRRRGAPSTASPRRRRGARCAAASCGSRPWAGSDDPGHQQHAGGDQDGLGDERPGQAGGEQGRPDRRAGELVERDEPGLQPGVGDAPGRRGAPASGSASRRCCRRRPRRWRAGPAPPAPWPPRRWPVTIVTTRAASTTARTASAAITIRRRSSRSDSTPAYRPNTSGGAHRSRAASETRNGSSVSEATSSGPAASAMPSPRLVVQDDASSQR